MYRCSQSSPCCGPGYSSPAAAYQNGPREKIIFITCPHATDGHDMIAAVDVWPNSKTFCQVISKVVLPHKGDEVHHSGWNACSSCYTDGTKKRSHLVIPCLNSNRIYIINVLDETNIFLEKTIEEDAIKAFGLSFPHTSHCLANGEIMISTLGDEKEHAKGDFLLLDGKTFEPKGTWPVGSPTIGFNYDFWYQPRRDVMISTEWGSPHVIKEGFNPAHVAEGHYGNSIHFFKWSTREKIQQIDLPGPEGAIPLEVRFLHEPSSPFAFVGTALGSAVYLFHPKEKDSSEYLATCVATVPPKKVSGWALPSMPGLITDILLSMNDKWLFASCWLHGCVIQYDITDPFNPVKIDEIYIGGSIHNESDVKLEDPDEVVPAARYIKGKRVEGGPQMMQMSLDAKRLYVTTSLYKKWDEQFYPNLSNGAMMLCIDVTETGMSLNEEFLIDFGEVEGGPYLCHEMRYPGGDCTSDIWI